MERTSEWDSMVTAAIFETLKVKGQATLEDIQNNIKRHMPDNYELCDFAYCQRTMKKMLCRLTLNGSIIQDMKSGKAIYRLPGAEAEA